MSKEWTRLYREDLPSDILVGDYEFEWSDNGIWKGKDEKPDLIHDVLHSVLYGYTYRYKRKETPAPTHEEIMTKWWKNKCGSWFRVNKYYPYYKGSKYAVGNRVENKEWFSSLESATIPPEVVE